MDLQSLRQKINGIDTQLLALLAERFACAKEIQKLKDDIEDTDREAALLQLWKQQAEEQGIAEEFIERLFPLILAESKRLQHNERQS